MSLWTTVLIVPAELRTVADALSTGMGHASPGVSTYVVPFRPIGGEGEATHYGCHAWTSDQFRAEVLAGKEGIWPEHFTPSMIALAEPVSAALACSFKPDGDMAPAEHVASVAAALGLERLQPEMPT